MGTCTKASGKAISAGGLAEKPLEDVNITNLLVPSAAKGNTIENVVNWRLSNVVINGEVINKTINSSVDGWSCVVGQCEKSQYSQLMHDNSKMECARLCDADSSCTSFDFTAKRKDDSCRLRNSSIPRIGDGGNDDREYCSHSTAKFAH